MTMQQYIQTSKPERPIYNYNYNPDDFLVPLRRFKLDCSDHSNSMVGDCCRGLQDVMRDYLCVQQRLRSYYSPGTLEVVMSHLSHLCGKQHDKNLNTLIYGFYLDMCIYDELEEYKAIWNTLSEQTLEDMDDETALEELVECDFYHRIVSYEFLERFEEQLDLSCMQYVMAMTKTLLTRFPELFELNEIMEKYDVQQFWSFNFILDTDDVDPLVDQVYREHRETIRDESSHGLCIGGIYGRYHFTDELVEQFIQHIDVQLLCVHNRYVPESVLLKHYDVTRCGYLPLIQQEHATASTIDRYHVDRPIKIYHILELLELTRLRNIVTQRDKMERKEPEDHVLAYVSRTVDELWPRTTELAFGNVRQQRLYDMYMQFLRSLVTSFRVD
jgi:hypothetical protein